LCVVAVAALTGCHPAGAQPRSAVAPDTSASERQYGSAMTVGLRVTLDSDSADEPHVRIAAVVRDLDGVETTTEVGEYDGTATQQPVQGDELVHVRVDNASGASHLTVRMGSDGQLEVHHQLDAGPDTTLRRIPLRDNVRVRASDPPVEQTN